jgi:hypothetical protein
MDDYSNIPDVPWQIALMAFVSLWGFFSSAAALRLAALAN